MSDQRNQARRWTSAFLTLAAGAILLGAVANPSAGQPGAGSTVVRIIGVGGVMTADGVIWQFRPDRAIWQTIDQSFHDQGKETHVLPLPVPAESIQDMVTFGFLLTKSGDCWLYDLNKDKWQKLPPPAASH